MCDPPNRLSYSLDQFSTHTASMGDALFENIDPPLPVFKTVNGPLTRSNSSWHLLAAALGIGVATEALFPSWTRMLFAGVALGKVSALSALLIALASAVILHETGHLLAALLMKFEILGGSLGPFRATRVHGNWHLQVSARNCLSGSVSAVPKSNESWRTRMLIVVAAGPAATFLTGSVSAVMLLACHGDWLYGLFSDLTQLSFFLFVLGLIPNRAEARVRNDARLFISLRRNTSEAQEILLYHLVTQLSLAGIRPRDYPERLIRKLSGARCRPDAAATYAYTIALWAMDRGDYTTAAAWDRRMVELSDSCELGLRNLMLARSACFHALFDEDLKMAKSIFADVNCDMLSPAWFMHRAKAAKWLTTGNIPETLAEVCRAQYAFPKRLAYYDFEKKLLGRIHQKALAAGASEISACQTSRAA